jgi:MFS family permease
VDIKTAFPMTPEKPLHSKYKWELLLLLCLAFFFHQGDRAIYGVVLPQISAELKLTESQSGLVGTVLFFTLAIMMPFAGLAGDRFRKPRVITLCLLGWSAATLFTGLAGGVVALVLLRSVATAGGESFYAPSAYSLLAKFHTATRSMAMSVHQAALYTGVMTSGFIGGWLAETWGWRHAFYIYGAGGILLGIVFVFRLRDSDKAGQASRLPDGGNAAATAPQNAIAGRQDARPAPPAPTFAQSFAQLFRVPTALLLTCGFTAIVCVNNAYVVLAPKLLLEKFPSLSLTLAGGYAMFFHHLAALAGVLAGGALSDRLVRARPTARIELQIAAMALGAPVIVWMGLAPSLFSVCAAMTLFGLLRGLYECNTHASLFDVIPPRFRATAVSVMTMLAFLVGSLTPWALGKVKDLVPADGYSRGFAALGALWVIGAAALVLARARTFKRDRIGLV